MEWRAHRFADMERVLSLALLYTFPRAIVPTPEGVGEGKKKRNLRSWTGGNMEKSAPEAALVGTTDRAEISHFTATRARARAL
jgi:hypothetical protein